MIIGMQAMDGGGGECESVGFSFLSGVLIQKSFTEAEESSNHQQLFDRAKVSAPTLWRATLDTTAILRTLSMYNMMKFTSSAALKCALLLDVGLFIVSGEITANPPEGAFILYDELNSVGWDETIEVDSNIPVTIQRYYDEDQFFLIGMTPVKENDMNILITSNCNSSATSIIPSVAVNSTSDFNSGRSSTSVTIQLDGAQSTTEFLTPSSYHAIWSYTSRCVPNNPPDDSGSSGGVSKQSEGVVNIENASSSSFCRKSFLFSALLLQGVLSKRTENQRSLESFDDCIFNAEILLDGCSHDLNARAPSVRVIDSTMVNFTKEESERCTTNYETELTFNTEPVFEGNSSLYVPRMTLNSCARPIEGRPFVDSLGNTLFATPLMANSSTSSWLTIKKDGAMDAQSAQHDPSTINLQSLGQEWTRSALGEHASIASFAAFSIALMTNGAPSNLVQDALNAALDEVRHARTSFAIASKLRGQGIEPGLLPESKHEFDHDLTALAVAVAKEGCIDETLSALDAAYKAELIGIALKTELEGTEYSGIDRDTLAWIQEELRVIAIDESRHSALAWRTINWICSVDREACDEVKTNVFKEDKLELAFRRRFGLVENLQIMQLWRGQYLEYCIEEKDVEVELYDLLNEAARDLIMQRHVATNSTKQVAH